MLSAYTAVIVGKKHMKLLLGHKKDDIRESIVPSSILLKVTNIIFFSKMLALERGMKSFCMDIITAKLLLAAIFSSA